MISKKNLKFGLDFGSKNGDKDVMTTGVISTENGKPVLNIISCEEIPKNTIAVTLGHHYKTLEELTIALEFEDAVWIYQNLEL